MSLVCPPLTAQRDVVWVVAEYISFRLHLGSNYRGKVRPCGQLGLGFNVTQIDHETVRTLLRVRIDFLPADVREDTRPRAWVTPRSLYNLRRSGQLKYVLVGKSGVRYAISDIEEFIERQTRGGHSP